MRKQYPNLPAVEAFLRAAGVPLTVAQIVRAGIRTLPTLSCTPETVVARDLSMDIKRNEKTRFVRAAPGLFTLRTGCDETE